MNQGNTDSPKTNTFERHPRLTAVALVLAGLFLFLLLDRVLAGIFLKNATRIKDPSFHHALLPNSFEMHAWGKAVYPVYTNSLGFKDKGNREIDLVTNKYRIVFIGDSFVEGLGYPYEKTFVGLVDNALDHSKYDVLNAGVMSYSPKLYYLKMKKLIEKTGLKMNEMVCFIDISDIQDEIVYEEFHPVNRMLLRSVENYILKKSLIGNKAFSLGESMTKRIHERRGSATHGADDSGFDPKEFEENYYKERATWTNDDVIMKKWGAKGLALCEQYMDKLYLLTRKHEIKLTIAVFPWPYQVLKNDLDSKQVKVWKKFAEDRGIGFINYFPYFVKPPPNHEAINTYYIPGDTHWNEEGNRLVAQVFLDYFRKGK